MSDDNQTFVGAMVMSLMSTFGIGLFVGGLIGPVCGIGAGMACWPFLLRKMAIWG